jgi:hypothetical protein
LAIFAVQNTPGKFHSLNGPAAAGAGLTWNFSLDELDGLDELARSGAV